MQEGLIYEGGALAAKNLRGRRRLRPERGRTPEFPEAVIGKWTQLRKLR
jgi:hypothetical protein